MRKRILTLGILVLLFLIVGCSNSEQNMPQKEISVQDSEIQKHVSIEEQSIVSNISSEKYDPIKEPANAEPAENMPKENKFLKTLSEIKNSLIYPREPIYYSGDLIIADKEYTINNSKFIIKGNIIINGTGKLIVRDSELVFSQDFNQQFRFYVQNNASLDFENVKLTTDGKWFNFQYNDAPTVSFKNVHGEDCCLPWHGSSNTAKFNIEKSTIGLTLSEDVIVDAKDSSLFFELVLTNSTGTFTLPKGYVEDYTLKIPNNGNKLMQLNVKNSEFTDWGTTLDKYTDITFVDSKMTIGINAGSDWDNKDSHDAVVKVSGLKTKTYDDLSLNFDTNRLHLINTFTRDWYPQAFNNATIEIEDSDLADLQNYGGTARAIVRDSNVMIAIARENVTYFFYDSVINQDVIAHDNANIYLYNTKVKGKIIENGNGKVWVDGKQI